VEDAVGAFERALQDVGLKNIAADVEDLDALILQRLGEIVATPPHEIVVDRISATLVRVNWSTVCDPMRPAPPMTTTFLLSSCMSGSGCASE